MENTQNPVFVKNHLIFFVLLIEYFVRRLFNNIICVRSTTITGWEETKLNDSFFLFKIRD
jgi:hypothetical protein